MGEAKRKQLNKEVRLREWKRAFVEPFTDPSFYFTALMLIVINLTCLLVMR